MHLAETLLALALGAVMLPATAAQFDFYKLDQPNAGVATDFLPTNGMKCTTHDRCSSDVDKGVFGANLSFVDGGITATATGYYNGNLVSVVQDSTDNWSASKGAGLGVYHLSKVSSDDNITELEKLIITFDRIVRLTSIELRAEGHNYTGWLADATFLFGNGNAVSQMKLPKNSGSIALGEIGQVFSFEFDLAKRADGLTWGDQFYLSSMTVEIPTTRQQQVPEPASLALALAALSAVGVAMRQRKA